MQILSHNEIKLSVSELREMVKSYNSDIYSENRRHIINLIESSLTSECPKDISIKVNELPTPMFILTDFSNVKEIESLVKEHCPSLLSNKTMEIIEESKSGRIIVYEDDLYEKEILSIDFENLDY